MLDFQRRPRPTYVSAVVNPIIFVCLQMLFFARPLPTSKSPVGYTYVSELHVGGGGLKLRLEQETRTLTEVYRMHIRYQSLVTMILNHPYWFFCEALSDDLECRNDLEGQGQITSKLQ